MTFPVDYDKFTILSKVRNHFTIRIFRRANITHKPTFSIGGVFLFCDNQLKFKRFYSIDLNTIAYFGEIKLLQKLAVIFVFSKIDFYDFNTRFFLSVKFDWGDISNTKDNASAHFPTPQNSSKILSCATCYQFSPRFMEMCSNLVCRGRYLARTSNSLTNWWQFFHASLLLLIMNFVITFSN